VRVDDLPSGEFTIFGKRTLLAPPVDWNQDPHGSRSWRYDLHTLKWLKPLLLRHAEEHDLASLSVARDFLCDWASIHLEPTGTASEFAWYDMAVGVRAPYFAYVLRASLVADDIDVEDAKLLLRAAERHGSELAHEAHYAAGHNHGLFQDEGLYILARQLSVLPEAAAWRSLALTRLRSTLEQTVNFAEGAHLEHSSAYQFSIAGLVDRLAGNVPEMPALHDLRDRLRSTAAWHVTPANRLVQLGDTDDVPAPKWACQAASKLHGLNALFETGQAFVREGDSYLAVSAGYHSPAHKHADDTGFVLIEGGRVLLGDAGRWGYYEEEPDRLYARSAAAHNVLTVDGEDFAWREAEPYGSGLVAAGEGDGWYAIVVRNPLLAKQGVEHRRILLFRPGRALIVVDDVRGGERKRGYARHLQFGPGLDADLQDGLISLTAPDRTATLTGLGADTVRLYRGRRSPRPLGWTYPGDREQREVCSAVLSRRASSAALVATLDLKEGRLEATVPVVRPDHASIELGDGSALKLHVDGRMVEVSRTRAVVRRG